ncbi:MAG: sporulation peptidase YabG [Bacilli bacterium]
MFKIGDTVTRKSYNNDIVFIITDNEDDTYSLKG